jgi:twitching motility protein PilJ
MVTNNRSEFPDPDIYSILREEQQSGNSQSAEPNLEGLSVNDISANGLSGNNLAATKDTHAVFGSNGADPISGIREPKDKIFPEETVSASLAKGKTLTQRLAGLNLRTKATALAIALSSLPLLIIGGGAQFLVDHTLTEQLGRDSEYHLEATLKQLNAFMFERNGDAQAVASLPIVRDPKVAAVMSKAERVSTLNRYIDIYGVYDNIAVFDLNGDVLLQSRGPGINKTAEQPLVRQVLKTQKTIISDPAISAETGKMSIKIAAPVKDADGQVIGAVRLQMPLQKLADQIEDLTRKDSQYYLVDRANTIILASKQPQLGKTLQESFRGINFSNTSIGSLLAPDPILQESHLITYGRLEDYRGIPNPQWLLIETEPEKVVYQSLDQLRLILAIGTIAAAAIASAIAAFLANRALHPIESAAETVERIGQGDLKARLHVRGEDELAVLGSNINAMAERIEHLVAEQQIETDRIEQARQEARQEADARAAEQRQQKEFLQRRALELLMEVDPVSKGDLTIRASVTSDEIGTIADSYNAIIRNLRQIVSQVQDASQSVAETTQENEVAVKQVATEATQQATVILDALTQIQAMAESSQGVSVKARQAEAQVQQANEVLQAGDKAMNRTVEGISTIRETVSETAKKVKRLGDASQKISKVVSLISGFASQTNLLALNAAIEAARAGEEGRGFSVVAEEVRILAQQSAAATAEIEQLVEEIQLQTNEVVIAMESGTEQVVLGTQLVEESRQKLNQISTVSAQVSQLIQEIAQAAAAQTQTSTTVSHTMQEVAGISTHTSKQSEEVAQSFSQLLDVAKALQVSVAQFKLG